MGQAEVGFQKLTPLALQLAGDGWRLNESGHVQLLVACCIAELLRIYAPDSPYSDAQQVKEIFLFFIKQLEGLKDTKSHTFGYCVYLLENLADVDSFRICANLEDYAGIYCALFLLIFSTVK